MLHLRVFYIWWKLTVNFLKKSCTAHVFCASVFFVEYKRNGIIGLSNFCILSFKIVTRPGVFYKMHWQSHTSMQAFSILLLSVCTIDTNIIDKLQHVWLPHRIRISGAATTSSYSYSPKYPGAKETNEHK